MTEIELPAGLTLRELGILQVLRDRQKPKFGDAFWLDALMKRGFVRLSDRYEITEAGLAALQQALAPSHEEGRS